MGLKNHWFQVFSDCSTEKSNIACIHFNAEGAALIGLCVVCLSLRKWSVFPGQLFQPDNQGFLNQYLVNSKYLEFSYSENCFQQ